LVKIVYPIVLLHTLLHTLNNGNNECTQGVTSPAVFVSDCSIYRPMTKACEEARPKATPIEATKGKTYINTAGNRKRTAL